MTASALFAWLCLIQGAYYVLTALWPLLSMRTFLQVTGPKTDLWLVRMVAVLVLVIGAVLLMAGVRHQLSFEILALAAGSAIGLTTIDVVYVVGRRIPPIYLLDAAAEILLLIAWAVAAPGAS